MPFTLHEKHLRRLCDINQFDVPKTGMVFFGLRACLPTNPNDHSFAEAHDFSPTETNNVNPRCTIGQWLPADATFAVFPGSTVPYINYIKTAETKNGIGANELMTGFYPLYERKEHMPETKTNWHEAFGLRDGGLSAIRRTVNDPLYTNTDPLEVSNPHDNIHAAYGMSMSGHYSSSGCQVILGFPKCANQQFSPEGGPWKTFKANAYNLTGQQLFPYFLLDAKHAAAVAEQDGQPVPVRLRFGSSGELVGQLQQALKQNGEDVDVDNSFGEKTLKAVLRFQADKFGVAAADGIVGEKTAAMLGIEGWKQIEP